MIQAHVSESHVAGTARRARTPWDAAHESGFFNGITYFQLAAGQQMRQVISLITIAILFQCVGCDHNTPGRLTFCVVDAATGKPLANVTVERRSETFGREISTCPAARGEAVALEPSREDGTVVASNLCSDQEHNFIFHKEGYVDGHVFWMRGSDASLNLPPFDPYHYERYRSACADHAIEVPLYLAKYKPLWKRIDEAPISIVSAADKAIHARYHGTDDDWRRHPDILRTWRNQYGVYTVCWFKTESQGWFHATGAIVNPPDEVVSFTGMSGSGDAEHGIGILEKTFH
ncbi:MAG TPA: hypothetical protein VFE47_26165 [Tepidisphaeraceae bacterium]|jgi:hypothetical protein|nr:hypothetical protein [Tepidisphaeraceae bacterium]